MSNEASARIKINRLLEEAGWRFFDTDKGWANILLENNVKITQQHIDDFGNDFEKTSNGAIDFLLVDDYGSPLVVLEAKREKLHPLSAKEQARKYAQSINAPYILLSNGNEHYLWKIAEGNPERISAFPALKSLQEDKDFTPDPLKIINEAVENDYITLTQLPNYTDFPEYHNEEKRGDFIRNYGLRFLRYYQLNAIKSIQEAVKNGKKRFLFEMATGTGKTLTAAAVIKLFFKTGNARRILFLVDRLELEEQARKDFTAYLQKDLTIKVYKESKDDWRKADIVITTIQSLLVNNKYRFRFSPTDFDLIISDESHRILGGGSSRSLFEYFLGYKLGLTATPKDYLKNFDAENSDDPREVERRILLDTYATFGCESGNPTFRYTLADGAKDGFLKQPIVVDARTEVTTKLLSKKGYAILAKTSSSETEDVYDELTYKLRDFERKFFSEKTNRVFVETFLDNGLIDPISGEFGKALVFAVSQNHAARLTQMLNEYAHTKWAGKYQSDFAVQVTSNVTNSQQMTVDFSNDKLLGFSQWTKEDEILQGYKTSKARVCVTVGMMTTGWDCPNILNLVLMRPIFSPTEFIQIKGRGTRIHKFEYLYKNEMGEEETVSAEKQAFKLFDFFAVCEYFEEKFDYDQVVKLPIEGAEGKMGGTQKLKSGIFEYTEQDKIELFKEQQIDLSGMKVDRMFFKQFEDNIKADSAIAQLIEAGNMDTAIGLTIEKYIDKPAEHYTLDKLRKSLKIDRKISYREVLEFIFFGNSIKLKEELLQEEFEKFIATINISEVEDLIALRNFFYAYITDPDVRKIIDGQDYTELYHNASFSIDEFSRISDDLKSKLPVYIKTYIPIQNFAA